MKTTALLLTLLLLLPTAVGQKAGESSPDANRSNLCRGDETNSADCITPPHVTYSPDPKYPPEEQNAGHEGVVLLNLVIGADGVAQDITVARSLSAALDAAALEAVETWKFSPATKGGKPISAHLAVQVEFRAASPKWKEYVYSENGFAITLPSDPLPHKSLGMSGTTYSVSLSNGARFSLYTMEASNNCVNAVGSQSAMYEKNKDAPPEGFKAISFREVSGTGYTGVEFVQQVPNGKLDYERWVCGSRRLYVFVSLRKREESEPRELRRIVDSFRILMQ